MARVYAGIMGSLAMTVVICRGLLAGGGVQGTLTVAIVNLVVFSTIGAVIGWIAQTTVDEAVRQRLEEQLAENVTVTGGKVEAAT